jgi:hypothetical protein
MRSVSEQPSVAGVADQLHGKISEKLASAVWIRPVGRLPGHFTRIAAVSKWASGETALLNLKQCCADVRAFEIRILASSIEKQFVLDAFMQI